MNLSFLNILEDDAFTVLLSSFPLQKRSGHQSFVCFPYNSYVLKLS